MSIKRTFILKEAPGMYVNDEFSVSEWAELAKTLEPIYYLVKREYPESAFLVSKLIRHAKKQVGR